MSHDGRKLDVGDAMRNHGYDDDSGMEQMDGSSSSEVDNSPSSKETNMGRAKQDPTTNRRLQDDRRK